MNDCYGATWTWELGRSEAGRGPEGGLAMLRANVAQIDGALREARETRCVEAKTPLPLGDSNQ